MKIYASLLIQACNLESFDNVLVQSCRLNQHWGYIRNCTHRPSPSIIVHHYSTIKSPEDQMNHRPWSWWRHYEFWIKKTILSGWESIKRIPRTVYGTQLAFLKKSFIITGMAQTTTELNTLLAAVDEAIAKLMSGERIIRISNGERMAEYGQAKLGELQNYKSSLVAEINTLNSKPRHFRISTSKGV